MARSRCGSVPSPLVHWTFACGLDFAQHRAPRPQPRPARPACDDRGLMNYKTVSAAERCGGPDGGPATIRLFCCCTCIRSWPATALTPIGQVPAPLGRTKHESTGGAITSRSLDEASLGKAVGRFVQERLVMRPTTASAWKRML